MTSTIRGLPPSLTQPWSRDRRACERRESQRESARRRRRIAFAIGAAVVVIAAVAIGVLALGGGNDDTTATRPTSSNAGPGVTFTFEAGDIATDSAGPATSFSPAQAQQVLGTIRTYVDTAVIKPLRSGQPAGDLSSVFDAGTLARATGVDRTVMLEEGLPKVTGDIVVTGKPVSFVGLGDQSGNLVLVTASVQFTVDGTISRHQGAAAHRATRRLRARARRIGRVEGHGVPHGRHPQWRWGRHDHGELARDDRSRPVNRHRHRTLLALVLTPVLCGLLVAGVVSAAWLALGSPTPARAAVWMQIVKTGEARAHGRTRPAVLRARARHRRAFRQPGRVAGRPRALRRHSRDRREPGARRGDDHRHPPRHRRPRRREAQLLHRELREREPPRRGERSVSRSSACSCRWWFG